MDVKQTVILILAIAFVIQQLLIISNYRYIARLKREVAQTRDLVRTGRGKQYHGLVATLNKDFNGNRFSKEALERLAMDAIKVPVTYNFDHNKVLGFVNGTALTTKGVELDMRLHLDPDFERIISLGQLFVVPSEIIEEYHKVGETTVIDKARLVNCSITSIPADLHLTPIERKEE